VWVSVIKQDVSVNVLVFNPSFLGDSILTTPLIKLIKRKFPDSMVFFCVRPENVPMFDGLSFIDEVIAFDKRGVHKRYKKGLSHLQNC